MVASYGFVTSKVGVHSTRYRLDDEFIAGGRTDISRNIPIASVDAGLYLDRPFAFLGRNYQQSLEPRAYFVYAGREDQADIPVFDTALLDFSYAQIFNESQFVGADRINDANQLTLAFTSRFVEDATAFERLRLTVGQRFYFDEQTVTLPGVAPRSSNATDLLLAASARFTNAWQVESAFQVNTESGVTVRRNLSASYRPAPGRTLNFGYRFIDQSTEQLDFSAQWPLAARWYGMFRMNYSLRDDQLVEGVAGVEYNGGCWVARGAIQRIATRQNQSTDALFIQLELNGLGRLGSNPLDVLKDSIPGYLTSHEITPP
jgi:LPS-assembly protein